MLEDGICNDKKLVLEYEFINNHHNTNFTEDSINENHGERSPNLVEIDDMAGNPNSAVHF